MVKKNTTPHPIKKNNSAVIVGAIIFAMILFMAVFYPVTSPTGMTTYNGEEITTISTKYIGKNGNTLDSTKTTYKRKLPLTIPVLTEDVAAEIEEIELKAHDQSPLFMRSERFTVTVKPITKDLVIYNNKLEKEFVISFYDKNNRIIETQTVVVGGKAKEALLLIPSGTGSINLQQLDLSITVDLQSPIEPEDDLLGTI